MSGVSKEQIMVLGSCSQTQRASDWTPVTYRSHGQYGEAVHAVYVTSCARASLVYMPG